ncbi:MAG: hypothetical protein IPL69_20095 [Saprospiraceae bacterium]|nr:hypothetical protein [Candidatus Brachybacter algidus]
MTASSFLGNCSYCQVVIVSPGLPCTISEVQDSINPATHIFTFNPIDPSNQIQWTFGDGGTAGNVTNVSHTFNSPAGVYTACAIEYDSTGAMVCQACIGVQGWSGCKLFIYIFTFVTFNKYLSVYDKL